MLRWTQAGWICPPSGLMVPLALLTYRPLLWKLDLRRPLISPVNCRRLRRCVFYRHNPLPKSSYFTTISINSFPETIFNLCHGEGKITPGEDLQAPHPAGCHMIGDASCSSPSPSLFWWTRFRHEGWGRLLLNQPTDDESLSSGQRVFTAQSLNSAGLPIRPPSIWLEDQSAANRAVKGDTEGKW